MTDYVPNGAGLEFQEGFSVPDGSGYILRRSNFGCKNTWPFAENWNFVATASGLATTFGPRWLFYPGNAHTGSVTANNVGYIVTSDTGIYTVGCPNLSSPTSQFAQVLWLGGTYAFNVDGGGPEIFCGPGGLNRVQGYGARLINKQTFDNSLGTTTPRLFLVKHTWTLAGADTGTTLASAVVPFDTGASNNGPFASSHTVRIEGFPDTGGTRLKCYVDGSLLINFLDTSPLGGNVPGLFQGGEPIFGRFFAGSL